MRPVSVPDFSNYNLIILVHIVTLFPSACPTWPLSLFGLTDLWAIQTNNLWDSIYGTRLVFNEAPRSSKPSCFISCTNPLMLTVLWRGLNRQSSTLEWTIIRDAWLRISAIRMSQLISGGAESSLMTPRCRINKQAPTCGCLHLIINVNSLARVDQ